MEPNPRYDSIHDSLRQYGGDMDRVLKALKTALPTLDDRGAYHEYLNEKNCPHLYFPEKIPDPDQFVQIADDVDFLNPADLKRLLPGLEWRVRPWVPLGRIGLVLYRLRTGLGHLLPHQKLVSYHKENKETTSGGHELLPKSFLGINTNVQPREPSQPADRRAANLSEQSNQSAESDDLDAPGFVFHELGSLEILKFDSPEEIPTTFNEAHEVHDDWSPTGFCVVARLGPSGRLTGVYAVYNMFPLREGCIHDRVEIKGGDWGVPPSPEGERFSVAKLGDRMADFGFSVELEWTDKTTHPVELVRAVRSQHGPLRVTVDSQR